MRLVPPQLGEGVNRGERTVFDAFAGADPSRTAAWTLLHSLDIAQHQRQVEGEVDFLLVIPGKGVLVLEVKGVRHISRRDGVWVYGDGPGSRTDVRGPFKQASDSMHSLQDRLVHQRAHLRGVPFASAACFPFLDFTETSAEWHGWQVIDRRAMAARPLADLTEGVLDCRREVLDEHTGDWFDPDSPEPTVGQCEEIVAALRPEFELFESPRSRSRRIEEEMRRYTEEQFNALDLMARNPRVVFDGPAGTGKTLLAIEAARRAVVAGRRVLFLCFNIPLRLWLADQTAELRPAGLEDPLMGGLDGACADGPIRRSGEGAGDPCDGTGPGVIVRGLHEQMGHVAGLTLAQLPVSDDFFLRELPERAGIALLEEQERTGDGGLPSPEIFDEIVVDEAQDILNAAYLEFLGLSLKGGLEHGMWRIFGDFELQRINRQHGSMTLEEFDPDGRWPVLELRVNCRNAPSVAALACRCAGVPADYCRVLRPEEEPPEIHGWRDAEEQVRQLARALEALHGEGFEWRDIAVLSTVADARAACAALPPQPWGQRIERVAQYTADFDVKAVRQTVEHPSPCIRCATIHRFKGLESRAVVITDVTRFDEMTRALLYVGATRTVERLVILAKNDVADQLRKLARAGGA